MPFCGSFAYQALNMKPPIKMSSYAKRHRDIVREEFAFERNFVIGGFYL